MVDEHAIEAAGLRDRSSRFVLFGCAAGAAGLLLVSSRLLVGSDGMAADLRSLGDGVLLVTGITALLLLAVRRIVRGRQAPAHRTDSRPPAMLVAAGVAMTLGILGIAGYGYRQAADSQMEDHLGDLAAVATLKVEGIEAWLDERRNDVLDFTGWPEAARDVLAWREGGDSAARDRLQDAMAASARADHAEAVLLLDPEGHALLTVGTAPADLAPFAAALHEAIATGRPSLVDLHRSGPGLPPRVALVGPITVGDTGPIAGIALEYSAEGFLFPYLRHWPLRTASGELILARRQGDMIEILDPIGPGSPESAPRPARVALAERDLPMARYFRGETVRGEAVDYRGEAVLATVVAVPGTGWALGAKENIDEAFGDLRRVALVTGLFTALALTAALGSTAAIWQRYRLKDVLVQLGQRRQIASLEQSLRRTLDEATIGIAHFDRHFACIQANPRLCRILGYDQAEMVGQRIRDLIHPDDRDSFDRPTAMLERGETPIYPIERRYLRKDGSIVWLSVTALLVHSDPDYFLGFYEDVTERRAAQAQLATSEARFRSYVETSPIAVLVADAEGRFVDSNPASGALLGYDPEALRGLSVLDVVVPDDRGKAGRDLTLLVRRGRLRGEYQLQRRDGTVVPIELSAVALTDSFYIAFLQDISARRQAEMEMRERLRLQERMIRISESVPGMIYAHQERLDGSHCFPFATSGIEDLYGVRADQVAETTEPLRRRIYRDDRERVREARDTSARDLSALRLEFRYEHPAKGLRWIETFALPRREADGSTLWFGFAADVTDRKRNEAALRDASAVLANADEGVFIVDRDGLVISVNAAFCHDTGYDEADIIGRPITVLRAERVDTDAVMAMQRAVEQTGTWQGETWQRRKNGESYPVFLTLTMVRDEHGQPINYAGTFTDLSRLKQQESQLEQLAHFDLLTGLPNRAAVRHRLGLAVERAVTSAHNGALLFLDLDRVKAINDSLGHPAGDEVLRLLAARLRNRLRDGDTLARLGGDEFAIILEGLGDAEDTEVVARSLVEQVLEPVDLGDGKTIVIGASIGITLFPADGTQVDDLFRNADTALHQAKADGRGVCHRFTMELSRTATERFDLETRLRRALERHEFVLHYQPLMSMADRRLVGVEALVRWEDPERGRISPMQFIPLAEDTGLIVPLGDWVLHTACAQMQAWRSQGVLDGVVAVNLSPIQFRQHDIVDRVSWVLEATGLPGSALELEITEGALMGNPTAARATLARLKALGVHLAIDDFGTGYSSLAYLKHFPIDKLKIDQSFVRNIPADPADAEIATAVISLARSLHLEALAEGVETQAQFDFLRARGCQTAQGYLFSAPIPPDELARFAASCGGPRKTPRQTARTSLTSGI